MICKPNKCINCDVEIHLPGETFQQKADRGVYKEILLELNDGSKMHVGICKDCLPKASELNPSDMLEAIKAWWRQSIRPERKNLLEEKLKTLEVVGLA